MKPTTKAFWKAIETQCELLSKDEAKLYLDEEKKHAYIEACDAAYKDCKEKIMAKSVENLDRHKVAAILVIMALELDVIKCDNLGQDPKRLFIGSEKVLVSCAISYLAQQVNHIIEKNASSQVQRMNSFKLPVAFSCRTNYIDIMCRVLYYDKIDNKLSLLDLADRFFLIEYIAIREYYQSNTDMVYNMLQEVTQSM